MRAGGFPGGRLRVSGRRLQGQLMAEGRPLAGAAEACVGVSDSRGVFISFQPATEGGAAGAAGRRTLRAAGRAHVGGFGFCVVFRSPLGFRDCLLRRITFTKTKRRTGDLMSWPPPARVTVFEWKGGGVGREA